MKRLLEKGLSRCVCWLAVCGFFLIFQGTAGAVGSFATLKEFSGEVMIKNAEEWVAPEPGMSLYSGAKIVTKEGSALVQFKDGATMTVDPFSSIRAIDQIQATETAASDQMRIRKIRVMLGRTKYEEQPLADRQTRIEMPMAVAALRGTGGYFGADEGGTSQGELYEGNMETSGIFQELVPQILALENALNSPTWTASLNSADQADNPLSNVQEIQAEIRTFSANLDPQVQAQVMQTLAVITPILQGIQQKIEKAQKAEAQKAAAQKTGSEDTRAQVKAISEKTSQTADTFVKTTQESTKADISLVLATIKGDQAGIALAQAAKDQNDRAVDLAGQAVDTAATAVELAGKATTDKQLAAAASVANTAGNTVDALAETVKTTNTSAMMVARDNQEGAAKMQGLAGTTESTLAAAEKSTQSSQNAIVLAQNEDTADAAVQAARTAEDASSVVKDVAQSQSEAAQAVADDDPGADAAIENTRQQSQTIDNAIQSLDESIEQTNTLMPAEEPADESADEPAEEAVDEPEQEEAPAEEPAEETEPEQPLPPDEQEDDTDPPSPV
jgi:hypothetical protein